MERYYRDIFDEERRGGLAILGAVCSLAYYSFWILTPAYNLLVNAASALILAGILFWSTNENTETPRRDWLASVLVGFGGSLSFLAKPTFAAIAAAAVCLLLIRTLSTNRKLGLHRLLITTLACVAPLLFSIGFTTGIAAFVASIQVGLSLLNSGTALNSLIPKTIKDFYYGSPLFALSVMYLAFSVVLYLDTGGRPLPLRRAKLLSWSVLIVDAAFVLWNVIYGISMGTSPWVLLGICSFCIVTGLICFGLIRAEVPSREASAFYPLFALLALPFALSFGSAISIMAQTGMYLYATLFASVIGGRLFLRTSLFKKSEMAVLVTIPLLLLWSSIFPFHLPASIYRQTESVSLPFASDTLLVDPQTKRNVDGLRDAARIGGLQPLTPIFDLSGGGPGIALMLNNRAPLTPWMFHMFGQPRQLVDAAWASMTPLQKKTAWIIGPIHPNFAGSHVAGELGKKLETHYELVGELQMRFGNADQVINVWKPR
jgi:hypothetical protein